MLILFLLLNASIQHSVLNSSEYIFCRFSITAGEVLASESNPEGEWVFRDQAGYSYEKIKTHALKNFEDTPIERGWFITRAQVSEGFILPENTSNHDRQTILYKYNTLGMLRTIINIYNVDTNKDNFIATTTRYFSGDYTSLSQVPGFTGLTSHGYGRCWLSD